MISTILFTSKMSQTKVSDFSYRVLPSLFFLMYLMRSWVADSFGHVFADHEWKFTRTASTWLFFLLSFFFCFYLV